MEETAKQQVKRHLSGHICRAMSGLPNLPKTYAVVTQRVIENR